MKRQKLGVYNNEWFDRGRPAWVEACWILVGLFVASSIPGSRLRVLLLRLFGADIEDGVVIKPRVIIKFPWRLRVGSNSWIGEGVWLDSLAEINIGRDCCLSQGIYICTGNHDWSKESFDLVVKPVQIEDECWIGAFARIAPGTVIGEGAVVSMGAIVVGDVEADKVYAGNPASPVRSR